MTKIDSPIGWFRAATPYISNHRGKTFVIYLPGHGIDHALLGNLVQDMVLLNSLGIRLVLVHGAAPQIERSLEANQKQSEFAQGIRITTPELLPLVEIGIGQARSKLEAELSKTEVRFVSGNHIKAKPLGIEDGVDFHNTGRVRKINVQSIRQQLETESIVIVSPLGYSPSGELFNINSLEVAGEVASALLADKFIVLDHAIKDESGALINEIQVSEIDTSRLDFHDHLSAARRACLNGVSRSHLLDLQIDGALLGELFTRDGVGTQVVRKSYEQVRVATADDVAGIIDLIEPLEARGILVKRSRERLESEIAEFFVIDRDGKIVGCAALFNYGADAELACLVTHPDYRDGTRGEILLKTVQQKAADQNCHRLFVLTTHTAHWFTEHGFHETALEDLPVAKQQLYNYQRNSKLLVTHIE